MLIPFEVKQALIQRNEAREALRETERTLQVVLERHAGKRYEIEGVPFKVCGEPGKRYWRRMVSGADAKRLREIWRNTL